MTKKQRQLNIEQRQIEQKKRDEENKCIREQQDRREHRLTAVLKTLAKLIEDTFTEKDEQLAVKVAIEILTDGNNCLDALRMILKEQIIDTDEVLDELKDYDSPASIDSCLELAERSATSLTDLNEVRAFRASRSQIPRY